MGARIYINNRPPHVQFLSTHRSVCLHRKPSIIFRLSPSMGARTDYASMGTDLLFASISTAEHRIARAILERYHARAMNELADWRLSFRFCFRVLMFVYQVKKQYSTANTVLLLPLTTKNSTVLLLPNQHRNKQQYNSTTIHDLNLQQ